VQDALKNQLDHISVTRLVFYQGRLVGYFTLVTDVIKSKEIAHEDGVDDFQYKMYSSLKIARLATHKEYERQRIGRNMLMKIFAIWIRFSKYIGCRIITVDSKPESVGFYQKFDFREAIIDPRKLEGKETVPLYVDIHKALIGSSKNRKLIESGR
jgi:GNAT superfamily N-acetyltransferase